MHIVFSVLELQKQDIHPKNIFYVPLYYNSLFDSSYLTTLDHLQSAHSNAPISNSSDDYCKHYITDISLIEHPILSNALVLFLFVSVCAQYVGAMFVTPMQTLRIRFQLQNSQLDDATVYIIYMYV